MARGKKPKLDLAALARVDQWLAAHPAYHKHFKVLMHEMGVSMNTILDAAHRRRAYREVARG